MGVTLVSGKGLQGLGTSWSNVGLTVFSLKGMGVKGDRLVDETRVS